MPAAVVAAASPATDVPSTRHRTSGLLATFLAACVVLVGIVALAGRAGTGDSDPPSNPSTAPAVSVDETLPAVPMTTIAPQTATPPTLAPAPPPARAVPGDRGKSAEQDDDDEGRGRGRGQGKKDD